MYKYYLAIIIICFLCFTNHVSHADPWKWLSPTPQGEQLRAVWGSSNEDVFAVGRNGSILHYNGNNWKTMNSNLPYKEYGSWARGPSDLKDVWGTSSTNIYAVGTLGYVVHYDGKQWNPVQLKNTLIQPVTDYELNFYAIHGTSANNIYAVGTLDTISLNKTETIFHFDGSQWHQLDIPLFGSFIGGLFDVWVSPDNIVYAVGDGEGWILKFDGNSWQKIWTGISNKLTAIWGTGDDNIFVGGVGFDTFYHYNGTTWSMVDLPTRQAYCQSISGTSPNNIYILSNTHINKFNGSTWAAYTLDISGGSYEPSAGMWANINDIFVVGGGENISHFDGISWNREDVNIIREHTSRRGSFLKMWGASSNDIFCVTTNGILRRENGVWKTMELPASTDGLSDIWGASNSDIFAVGWQGNIVHFDGLNWNKMVSNTTENLNAVWGTSSNNVYAAGWNGTLLHYNGVEWKKITSYTFSELLDIWGTSANNIYVSGDNFLLHYNGYNWDFVQGLSDMCSSEIYGCGKFWSVWGTSPDSVFVGQAHFDGVRWRKVPSDMLNLTPLDIWGNSSTGIYATDGHTLMKYNGLAWNELLDTYTFGNYHALWGIDNELFLLGIEELRYLNTYIPPSPDSLEDAIKVLQIVVGLFPSDIEQIGDISGDGNLGIAEVIYALRAVAGFE